MQLINRRGFFPIQPVITCVIGGNTIRMISYDKNY